MTSCQNPDDIPVNLVDIEQWRQHILSRYDTKAIIATNTIKDLRHIANYLYSGSVVLTDTKRDLLTREFQNTAPNNALGYDAVCPDEDIQ
jgi:nitrous oxidase accessory protein NosD